MAKIQKLSDRSFEGVEAAYTEFTWVDEPHQRYPELIQVRSDGEHSRNARGFVVEDEVWFQEEPPMDHEAWWDEVISNNYDRDWRYSEEPNQILYFKVVGPNTFQVPFPHLHRASNEAILRMAHLMKSMDVPESTTVTWAISKTGIYRENVGDYYALI